MNTLEILKNHSPEKLKRFNHREVAARIYELESSLGIPHVPVPYSLREFKGRLDTLEAVWSRQCAAASPPPRQEAIPLESAPAKSSTEQGKKPNETEKCLASVAFRKKHAVAIEIANLRQIAARSTGVTKTALESKIAKLQAK